MQPYLYVSHGCKIVGLPLRIQNISAHYRKETPVNDILFGASCHNVQLQ